MKNILFIALGGSLGSIARYGISKSCAHLLQAGLPWGTVMVNAAGSLLLGFFAGIFSGVAVPEPYRNFITIGLLGAFTTFSTYSLETVSLLREGEIKLAMTNVLLHNALGVALALTGLFMAGYILKQVR